MRNPRLSLTTALRGAWILTAALLVLSASQVSAQSRTWTTDADFEEGTLINVNHDPPNGDQLQLSTQAEPFPFVYIACSSRGTAVRIDVESGAVLGEFLTAPNGMGRNPSRTTVDLSGNVWVANRDESSGGRGSVVRIGLVIGGTRVDADGNPDPTGQYLAPPYQYNTCIDRHGATVGDPPDGLIKTSRGLGDFLGWSNAGGADSNGGVSTAEDESIINYTRVNGSNTRTVAVDANNDVWVGGLGDFDHEKLDGATGQPVPGTQFNLGCGGYGGLIDGNGVLWSARGGSNLLRFEPNPAPPPAGMGTCFDPSHGDYGLGLDPQTGHIWHTNVSGNRVAELAPDGTLLNAYTHGNFNAQGVVVDSMGNVWVAHSLIGPATTVGHLRTDGTYVGNVSLPGGSGPTGVAVDRNGKVWVANIYSHDAMRIDPAAGPIGGGGYPVGAVDLVVDLNAAGGAPAGPYNYSDMTGFVALAISGGSWTVMWDSGSPGATGCVLTWNLEPEGSEPEGTAITVAVRAADNPADLSSLPFVPVVNGDPVTMVAGQYWEVRASLDREDMDLTPVLSDLTISCEVPVDIKPGSCPNSFNPRSKGVLPVAFVSSFDFDATQVDPATVLLSRADGVGGSVAPLMGPSGPGPQIEDVATPFDGEPCDCHALGGDGLHDLSLKFSSPAVRDALLLDGVPAGTQLELVLSGTRYDGVPVSGRDCIRLVPPKANG